VNRDLQDQWDHREKEGHQVYKVEKVIGETLGNKVQRDLQDLREPVVYLDHQDLLGQLVCLV